MPGEAYRRPGPALKEQGIAMYLEGSGMSAIGRLLGVQVHRARRAGLEQKGGRHCELNERGRRQIRPRPTGLNLYGGKPHRLFIAPAVQRRYAGGQWARRRGF